MTNSNPRRIPATRGRYFMACVSFFFNLSFHNFPFMLLVILGGSRPLLSMPFRGMARSDPSTEGRHPRLPLQLSVWGKSGSVLPGVVPVVNASLLPRGCAAYGNDNVQKNSKNSWTRRPAVSFKKLATGRHDPSPERTGRVVGRRAAEATAEGRAQARPCAHRAGNRTMSKSEVDRLPTGCSSRSRRVRAACRPCNRR